MIDQGRHSVLGVGIHAVDYEMAVHQILAAAENRVPFSVSALAVHGVMTGVRDPRHLYRLNRLDLVVPDGQPVRWALRWLHGIRLPDRVYGPTLTLKVCEAAATRGVSIYLYGSRREVLEKLSENLKSRFPGLLIAGMEPSKFRRLSPEEVLKTTERIQESGAGIVFVGLGCPRQEVWAFEFREKFNMPILAVGAAFDFHAGSLSQAPSWMQRAGLEWLYRLTREPKRLWRRYLVLNPWYLCLILRQKCFPQTRWQETEPGEEDAMWYG
ncbi:MAG: WecB/TagA/CpsF family glycosyltransferase [Verrucomicrobia bacterium]|nr:WecB/TagA/CpsF family glycosyltransferase [Verrucomicrobiota bacterium]MCH8511784.1 WecB/TagA/CpsF family glycosyltransferase [Kiritimatiellia bacterium]